MQKAAFTALALVFTFLVTSDAFAYKYTPGKEYNDNVRYTRYGHRDGYDYTFYKKSVRRGHYASRAPRQRNPYRQNVSETELQKMEEKISSRYNNEKAPTGNYPRRAFMPNK